MKRATTTRHMSTLRTCLSRKITPGPPIKSYAHYGKWLQLLPRSIFERYFEECDDHRAYEHPTNVPVLWNHFWTSDTKVTPIPANGRYSYRDRDSRCILKRATTTRHLSTLRTCLSCKVSPIPPTQKLCPFPQMASTLTEIEILKIF